MSFFILFLDGLAQNMASLDLLSYLKEQGRIEEDNLECLIEALTDIGRRDLVKKVQEFENKYKNSKPGLFLIPDDEINHNIVILFIHIDTLIHILSYFIVF